MKNLSTSSFLCFSIFKSYLCYCRSIVNGSKMTGIGIVRHYVSGRICIVSSARQKENNYDILKVSKFSNDMYPEEKPIEPNWNIY